MKKDNYSSYRWQNRQDAYINKLRERNRIDLSNVYFTQFFNDIYDTDNFCVYNEDTGCLDFNVDYLNRAMKLNFIAQPKRYLNLLRGKFGVINSKMYKRLKGITVVVSQKGNEIGRFKIGEYEFRGV